MLTNAVDGLRHATNANRDTVVQVIDEMLYDLRELLGNFAS